jgi:kynurenine formamidase
MKVIDLSHTIEPGMPLFPGTKPPELTTLCTIKENGYSEKRISISSHTGTHIDAPAHILPTGVTFDQWSIDHFAGTGAVLDFTELQKPYIEVEQLQPYESLIRQNEFILLRTGWSRYWGEPSYFEGYPVLSTEAARWLGNFQLKGVGMDAISVDEAGSIDLPVHHILLECGLVIIENLAHLEQLPAANFVFCCFPLKMEAAEASPIRAAGIIFNE